MRLTDKQPAPCLSKRVHTPKVQNGASRGAITASPRFHPSCDAEAVATCHAGRAGHLRIAELAKVAGSTCQKVIPKPRSTAMSAPHAAA
jgi:hypothetical protein